MLYLDHGATSFPKPAAVRRAVGEAMARCANPGRGSHRAAARGAQVLYQCREAAGGLFHVQPEQVVLTTSCTHGLNIAIRTLVKPESRVAISGFEHNAVVRPLHALGAKIIIAGRKLFCPEDTLTEFVRALDAGAEAAVFTMVSNVFGYRLPVEEMSAACRRRGIPFAIDAAQSAGMTEVDAGKLGADFVAMPGHKGLLGPMGTGLLLCAKLPEPLIQGGTGSESENPEMPDFLPDRGEAGTANVPGFAGLLAGIRLVTQVGPEVIGRREAKLADYTGRALEGMGFEVFRGPGQRGTVSFRGWEDCQILADRLAQRGVAVRAGLHCAPLAHESAGTLETGTVRVSFGHDSTMAGTQRFLEILKALRKT